MKSMGVLFWVFLVIGLGCLALGVNDFIHQEAWFARAVAAQGTITAYDLHVRNDGKSEYCPRIEFTTQVGEPATTYGSDCPNQPDKSQIGRQVTLYYDPANPEDTRSKGWANEEGSGLVFGGIGCLFFPSIGALSFGLTYWQNRKRAAATLPPGYGHKSILEQDAERYHANQRAAERAAAHAPRPSQPAAQQTPPPASPAAPTAEEIQLAQLKQQEEALQRKIEERRRSQGQ